MTIIEFINVNRIENAKKMLTDDRERKVIDIAYDCGFQSLSQFNRTFQKYADCSPTQHRKGGF